MLYTISKAQYDTATLNAFLRHLNGNDIVILWQDGVLQAVKNSEIFANIPNCCLLEQDVTARGLSEQLGTFKTISLSELVKLTETHFPHIGV